MGIRKYTDKQYIDNYPFEDDSVTNVTLKIVYTRKAHVCVGSGEDGHALPANTRVIKETGIVTNEGWKSCYLCFDCADCWLSYTPISDI